MITYVSEEWLGDSTVVVGVSSEWNTAVKRIMDQHPDHKYYKKVEKKSETFWEVHLDKYGLAGFITKVELDRRVS